MKRSINNEAEVLKLLHEIGTEEPMICVDEVELRTMFKSAKFAMWLDFYAEATHSLESQLVMVLKWFVCEAKREPKSVYFKLESRDKPPKGLLEKLQRLGECAGKKANCIFAYDKVSGLSAMDKFHMQVLIA